MRITCQSINQRGLACSRFTSNHDSESCSSLGYDFMSLVRTREKLADILRIHLVELRIQVGDPDRGRAL